MEYIKEVKNYRCLHMQSFKNLELEVDFQKTHFMVKLEVQFQKSDLFQ